MIEPKLVNDRRPGGNLPRTGGTELLTARHSTRVSMMNMRRRMIGCTSAEEAGQWR